MNNRDLIEFAKYFSHGVDKSVNAYEKAQAAEIARARNKILEQDKRDNQAYRQQMLALKAAEGVSLDKYRTGMLDVKRMAAANKGAGANAGLSPEAQAVLTKYGAPVETAGGQGGTTINNYGDGNDGADALAVGSGDMPEATPLTAPDAANGGMIKSFAGGGIATPGMAPGGIDGDTPIPASGAAGSRSGLASGANMFASSFKVKPYYEGIDETGAVRRGQTRLQRWLDGPSKGGAAPTQAVNPNPPVPGAIQTTPLAPLYARGGVVRPVDPGTSGPVSGFGYRAAPPVTRRSN